MDTQMQALIRSTSAVDFPDVQRFIQRNKQGEVKPPAVVASAILNIFARDDLQGGERYDATHFGA
jgi:hypothetical protein